MTSKVWTAEFVKKIIRDNDVPCDMYLIREGDFRNVTLGIDAPYDTQALADWIVDCLNKGEAAKSS